MVENFLLWKFRDYINNKNYEEREEFAKKIHDEILLIAKIKPQRAMFYYGKNRLYKEAMWFLPDFVVVDFDDFETNHKLFDKFYSCNCGACYTSWHTWFKSDGSPKKNKIEIICEDLNITWRNAISLQCDKWQVLTGIRSVFPNFLPDIDPLGDEQ